MPTATPRRRLLAPRLLLVAAMALGHGAACTAGPAEPLRLRTEVLAELPHDPSSYTQGLLWHDGSLFESTGQYGQSTLRRNEPATGTAALQIELDSTLFGEGLARVGDRLIQLTWKAGTAFVYDVETLQVVTDELHYRGPGWGLCFDGQDLVMSNGTSWLVRRDPETFRELQRLQVRLDGAPVEQLNELECAEGWIYANVYMDDRIVRIAPDTGEVVAVIDASALRSSLGSRIRRSDALNGIAFRAETASFFVTGKNWPTLFEVIFVE